MIHEIVSFGNWVKKLRSELALLELCSKIELFRFGRVPARASV